MIEKCSKSDLSFLDQVEQTTCFFTPIPGGEQYSKWGYSEDDKNGRKMTKPEFRENDNSKGTKNKQQANKNKKLN